MFSSHCDVMVLKSCQCKLVFLSADHKDSGFACPLLLFMQWRWPKAPTESDFHPWTLNFLPVMFPTQVALSLLASCWATQTMHEQPPPPPSKRPHVGRLGMVLTALLSQEGTSEELCDQLHALPSWPCMWNVKAVWTNLQIFQPKHLFSDTNECIFSFIMY